jgi:archaeosine-15-forming tRNA-guanine transglycosylase
MPRLRNIWINPDVEIIEERSVSLHEQELRVRVTGLVCDGICVRRARQALSRLPNVRSVTFNAQDDSFTLRYTGPKLPLAQVQAAVHRVVVARPARWAFDRLGKFLSWLAGSPHARRR